MDCRRNVTPTKTYLFFVSGIILYRHGSSVNQRFKSVSCFLAEQQSNKKHFSYAQNETDEISDRMNMNKHAAAETEKHTFIMLNAFQTTRKQKHDNSKALK